VSGKFEIRSSKSETSTNDQKAEMIQTGALGALWFKTFLLGFRICFGFRVSCFGCPQQRFHIPGSARVWLGEREEGLTTDCTDCTDKEMSSSASSVKSVVKNLHLWLELFPSRIAWKSYSPLRRKGAERIFSHGWGTDLHRSGWSIVFICVYRCASVAKTLSVPRRDAKARRGS
jgi:hypothetical protein